MRVGNLVKRRDDHTHHGIVVEVGPQETAIDHGSTVAKVQWNDGNFGLEEWSNPGIVLEGYEPPNDGLWVVWVDDVKCVVDETNYEVVYLDKEVLNESR